MASLLVALVAAAGVTYQGGLDDPHATWIVWHFDVPIHIDVDTMAS